MNVNRVKLLEQALAAKDRELDAANEKIVETFWRKHGKAFKGERDEQAD